MKTRITRRAFSGKLHKRWIFTIISCRSPDQVVASRIHHQNTALDFCAKLQSSSVCLSSNCHAVFYIRNYRYASKYNSKASLIFNSSLVANGARRRFRFLVISLKTPTNQSIVTTILEILYKD